MKQELTDKLYAAYPNLFRGRLLSVQVNLMPFGLECGDGWYDIVNELCHHLAYLADLEGNDPLFAQIKEKFGGIRIYTDATTEIQDIVISHYESKSYHTCEVCGEDGVIRNSKHWISTLCDTHAHQRGYAISDRVAKEMGLAVGEYVSLDDLRATAKTLREFT